jgi:hypothetical protein
MRNLVHSAASGCQNDAEMGSNYRDRRFVWIAPYFVVVGFFVIQVFVALESLGAALSADPAPPIGIGRFIREVGPYCLIGAIAACLRNVRLRATLAILAQIIVIVTIAASSRTFLKGLENGVIYCGVLLVPFGWVWFVLLMDLVLTPRPRASIVK